MYRLSLKIDGDITIEAFKEAIASFLSLLREVEQSVAGERAVRWTLEDIRRTSPALMTWKGTPRPIGRKRTATRPSRDYAPLIGTTLLSGVRKLERGEGRPELFTDDALDASANLARVKMRRGITALSLIGEDGEKDKGPSVSDVTERVAASVKEIIGPKYSAPGAVEGRLQAINSHGLLYFVIYDAIFGSRVRCDIPPRLKPEALTAFDERVLVTGTVARDADGRPRHITAEKIEVLSSANLPQSIRGIDPDFTGDMESSQYAKRWWSGNG